MTQLVQSVFARQAADLLDASATVPDGVDLLEVRADVWQGATDELLAVILGLARPCIVTVRARADGGHFEGTEEERVELLTRLAPVAAYVDVELGRELATRSFEPARKLLSYHDFDGTPADLPALLARMQAAVPDAAVLKIAVTPNSGADLLRVMQLLAHPPVTTPVAAMAMGARGVVSRLLGGKFGTALVYACTPGQDVAGPGQLDSATMTDLYRLHRQGPGTRVFAVTGNPLGHSLSPLLHNTGYGVQGLDCVYVPLEVEHLAEAEELAETCDIHGLSVTLPFKEDADRVAARRLVEDAALRGPGQDGSAQGPDGVANTLVLREGAWCAANTDASGFLEALTHGAPDLNLKETTSLVLGAGGVARTAVACLRQAGSRVSIASRTRDRAERLAAELDATVVDVTAEVVAAHTLIVNATPVGMHPDTDASPLPDGVLGEGHLVFDLIYRPRPTLLLRQARQAGARTIDGLEMFLRQGFAQYRMFTGQDAPEEETRRAVEEALARP